VETNEQQKRPKLNLAGLLQWITLAVCVVILAVAVWSARGRSDAGERIDDRIALASTMLNQGLPAEAIAEYGAALDLARGDNARKANLCYLIGKTYFETLKNYEKALGYFARAKHYNANHPEAARMEKWSVECLERLGRSLDARNRIARATALRPNELPSSGTVVAKIGDRTITMNDLDAEIRRMPPEVQKYFAEPEEKAKFLEDFVAARLLSEAARRAGLQNDPKFLSEMERAREEELARLYFEREIASGVSVTPDEIKLYYDAHKDEFRQSRRLELSHIELTNQAAATSVTKELESGKAFDALARKVSINAETREKGGRLGSWTEGQPLPAALGDEPELAKAVGALQQGQNTTALKTKSGKYEIVHADEVTSSAIRAFDEVRDTVASRLRQEKMRKRQEEVLARLREAEKVVIYRDAVEGKKPSK
jgi:peptidyl-prolyl cis-trans isomerase C